MNRFQQLDKALRLGGSLYSLDDIIERINSGDMQGFVRNETWVVTAIVDYPRRRVLYIIVAVGDLIDAVELEKEVVEFATNNQCTLIASDGRSGWNKFAVERGWKSIAQVYHKEMV